VTVTVAIPIRDGGELLDRTLAGIRGQRVDQEVELIVCDSGSRDGSIAVARSYGADVIEIPPAMFSHGGTRNLLMERSQGEHVAFLSQDAVPADDQWLARLLGGFSLAENVALVFGPYQPRTDASPMIARELIEWFASLSPDGRPRVDQLAPTERDLPARALHGRRGFFTDANGCVTRAAWESVPFRAAAYAEDHLLAHDMLRAGFAKVYLADAAVIHSHEYSGWDWLRRSFDEARAMQDVYGFSELGGVRRAVRAVRGGVAGDRRWALSHARGVEHERMEAVLARSLIHHLLRAAGTMLGTRARRLPAAVVRRLSLEGRAG
jgi:glycosyltransferase involved in cell wall biosynthesis